MSTYYILIGAPGSGKSVYAKKLAQKGCRVVSPDAIRDSRGVGIEKSYEMAKKEIKEALVANEDAALDATNISREKRALSINIGKPYADKIIGIWLDTPFNICVKRHFERIKKDVISERYATEIGNIPYEKIIERYCLQLAGNIPDTSEGFDEITRVKPES